MADRAGVTGGFCAQRSVTDCDSTMHAIDQKPLAQVLTSWGWQRILGKFWVSQQSSLRHPAGAAAPGIGALLAKTAKQRATARYLARLGPAGPCPPQQAWGWEPAAPPYPQPQLAPPSDPSRRCLGGWLAAGRPQCQCRPGPAGLARARRRPQGAGRCSAWRSGESKEDGACCAE